jgi:hypothetical protein
MRRLFGFVLGLFLTHTAWATFPPQVALTLKEKTSCREAKKIGRNHRLFVHCDAKDHLAKVYSADYLGKGSLASVIYELAKNSKVEGAVPYDEAETARR